MDPAADWQKWDWETRSCTVLHRVGWCPCRPRGSREGSPVSTVGGGGGGVTTTAGGGGVGGALVLSACMQLHPKHQTPGGGDGLVGRFSGV